MFIFFLCFAGKERKRTKRKKLGIIKKHSKYFQNKFCIHFITFQAVKIYFKNKLCLINVTTAKPYYAYGVQGNLALFNLDICNEILNLVNANNPRGGFWQVRRVSPKDEPSTSCEKVRRRGICETNQSGVKNFELPIIQDSGFAFFS